jgi:SPP1 gp7 family putative phage head morphogenesis protein
MTTDEIDPAGRPGDTAVVDRDLIDPSLEEESLLPGAEAGKSVKDVPEETIGQSVQEFPKQVGATPGTTSFQDTLIWFTGHAADEFEAWGRRHGKRRDKQLRDFIATESMFASALGIVIIRNSAFNWEVSGDPQTADIAHQILIEANMGLGWEDFIAKVSADLYTQDSGAFIEVVRDGSDPESPLVGINHLDAARCWHTGDPTKPVIYQDVKSKYHLLDWWNVVTLSEMPTAIEGLYGMQFCAETRLMMAAQIMKNIAIYKAEKSGGRNTRAIQLIQGLTTEQVNDAIADLRNRADAQGFMRYMQPVIIGSHDPQAKLDVKTLELVSLPDGFDEDTAFRHYIAMIAMAFGADYQEFAPLPGGNLGTSMQSQVLHDKTRGKGPGLFMKLIQNAMNQRILPRNVKFEYAEQDLEAERTEAEVSKIRAETRKIQIESTEINQAESRQMAVDSGDLPQELFDVNPGGDITPVDTVVPSGEPHHAKGELEVSPSSNPFGSMTTDVGTRQKTEPARAGPFEDDRLVAEGRLQRAILRAFRKHFEAVKKRLRRERRDDPRFSKKELLGDLVNDEEFWGLRKEEFMAEVGDQPLNLLLEGGQQAEALGLVVDMSLVNQEALRFNRQFTNRWWQELSTQTRDGLRIAISTHIETGGPLRTLNKNLEPLFGKARAEVVGRTEVTRMFAEGNRIAYGQAGIQEVEWRTVRDAHVDPICDDLHGQRMPLGQEQIVPPAHPRCRCWIAPVVGERPVTETASREFESGHEADAWGNEHFSRVLGRESIYTEAERVAILEYQSTAYAGINRDIRAGFIDNRTVRGIDSAIAKGAVPEDIIVWRAIREAPESMLKSDLVGGIIQDRAVMSTSLLRNVASDFGGDILLRIKVPRGTPASYFAGGQAELLLGRDTVLRVLEVRRVGRRLEILAEVQL